eukprot:TRINITY_DN110936_c0_g1_i1.p1 TRINITY_DN110936_c0_g1~~TRINITY_DN110936_c0_g1_i1.p1  ORF type:complete len:406 (+),score=115.78 TRINITY_DN110936_c0_g1_i1:96-1313(+)
MMVMGSPMGWGHDSYQYSQPRWKGGGGGGNRWQDRTTTSPTAYVAREFGTDDSEGYSGAALIPYRKVDGKIELLLAWERPWNSFISGFDPVSWTVMGGKRISWYEHDVVTTAVRCFAECADGAALPSEEELQELADKGFAVWYPTGKFGTLFVEVPDGMFADLPAKYAEANQGPKEEFKLTSTGHKKWTKMIDALEWVPAEDILPTPKKECSDLVKNILQVSGVKEVIFGEANPAEVYPDAEAIAEARKAKRQGANGKGDKGGKGGKGGYSKGGKGDKGGKSGKGKGKDGGMAFGGGGKGMSSSVTVQTSMKGSPMPMMPMPMPYAMPDQSLGSVKDETLQRQMCGEQLYILIQPIVPSQYIAQKVTGMLLELPMNELMDNLMNQNELHRRVEEAMVILKEDGIV